MPNSDVCLNELIVSAPALASPMILAFDACAFSRNEEKSVAGNGWRTWPSTLPPFLDHDRSGIPLERVTEGVVGGQEEPGVAAGLHDRLPGAVGQRPGVVKVQWMVFGVHFSPVRSEVACFCRARSH